MATQDIRIKVKANTSKAQSSMKKLTDKMGGMRNIALASAAAIAGLGIAFGKMIQSVANAGDAFDKMSKRLGVSVETLSELKFAAERSGSSIDDIEKAMKKMAKAASDANDGLLTYQRAFDKVGVSILDAGGKLKDMETLFFEVSAGIAKLGTNTEKTAAAVDLFGRAGTKLLPLMSEQEEGLAALVARVRELGGVYSTELAEASAALIDAQLDLKTAFAGLGIAIAEEVLPHITEFFEQTATWVASNKTEVADAVNNMAKAFKELGGALVTVAANYKEVNEVWDSLKFSGIFEQGPLLTSLLGGADFTGGASILPPIEEDVTGGEDDISTAQQSEIDRLVTFIKLREDIRTADSDLRIEAEIQLAEDLLEIDKKTSESRLAFEQIAQDSKLAVQQKGWQLAALLAGKNANAVFAVQKAVAVVQIILATNVAAAAVMSLPPMGVGPIAGAPLSVAIQTRGYINAALTAALAIGQLATSKSGSSFGFSGSGTITSSPTPSTAQFDVDDDLPRSRQIHIEVHGNIIDHAGFVRELAEFFGEAEGDNVVFLNA